MTKPRLRTQRGGKRSVADCETPEWVLDELKQAVADGCLEELLMARNFGLQAAVQASKALREVRAVDEDRLVQERIARGGRPAPKPPSDLSNSLPDRDMDQALKPPQPVPGVYEYMGLFEDDGRVDDGA